MTNNSKREQHCNAIACKFGAHIPQNVQEAKVLDEECGNTLWFNATKLELQQLQDCNAVSHEHESRMFLHNEPVLCDHCVTKL